MRCKGVFLEDVKTREREDAQNKTAALTGSSGNGRWNGGN